MLLPNDFGAIPILWNAHLVEIVTSTGIPFLEIRNWKMQSAPEEAPIQLQS